MKSARSLGLVGGLAIALGTGAWLASVPWLAAADPDSSGLGITNLSRLDPSLLGPAAADPSGLNIDVSYNGIDLFQMGDATATSGSGDWAIAIGGGADACAGACSIDGLPVLGSGDSAFADGAGSTAIAGGANYDSAMASNGATAYSGLAVTSGVATTGGADDFASASGAGSTAEASGGSFNTAAASDGGTADSGFIYQPGHLYDSGIGDSASASGAGSTAAAGFGNSDSAEVFGDNSTALAGSTSEASVFNNDFAGTFGNDLSANATGASNLFQIASPFGDFAVPSDDLGLSALLNDLGMGATLPGLDGLLNLF